MADEQRDRRRRVWRWRVFAATWLSYAGLYFARKPYSIAKASVGEAMSWDAGQLGMLGASYLIAYAVGQFLAGAAGTRWGPRLVLLVGMGGSIVANAAMGFTNSLGTFAALLALNGLAQATGWSNNVGTMGNWFARKERGRVMGIWATNYQVGGVLANTLAAYLLGLAGWQWSFFGGSIVLSAVWIFFFFNQRNEPTDVGLKPIEDEEEVEPPAAYPDEEPAAATEGDGERVSGFDWPRAVVVNVLIIGVFYFFVKFIRYALWSWAPFLLETSYGLEGDEAGYISTVFDVAGVAGVIACGWVSDKIFDGHRAIAAFLFILGLGLSCVVLFVFGPVSVALFAVSMGMVGFSLYGPDALMTGAGAIDVGSARRATLAAGIINGMGSIGAIVQELLLGEALSADVLVVAGAEVRAVDFVFATLLVSATAAAACLAYLLWRNRRGTADV